MNRAGKIWSGFLLIAAMIMFGRCSSYTGKSLLTIFFDGVPADSMKAVNMELGSVSSDSTNQTQNLSVVEPPSVVVHYPYGERECASCHDQNSLGAMVESQPRLCYMCHEDFAAQYTYLHGPGAGGYCTSCHDPHMSENENLLRYTGEQLCFHCHKAESVYTNEMHQDLEGMECTDCHNPHGGEDKYIFY